MTAPAPVPERPRLRPWYRVAFDSNRAVLEHGGAVVVFTGAAASVLLPALLPLLDGTRTIGELVQLVGRPVAPAIENALQLLAEHGLLTSGGRLDPGERRTAVEAVAGAGSIELDAGILERLSSSRVTVLGADEPAEALARLLHRSCIDSIDRTRDQAHEADLVVVLPDSEPALLEDWNVEALERGTTWIPVGEFDGRTVVIGPLVVPGETACHSCATIRRASTSGCASDLATVRRMQPKEVVPPWLQPLVAGLAAHQIVRWLAVRDPQVPGLLTTVEVSPELAIGTHPVLRVPRCPSCSRAGRFASPMPWHEVKAEMA